MLESYSTRRTGLRVTRPAKFVENECSLFLNRAGYARMLPV